MTRAILDEVGSDLTTESFERVMFAIRDLGIPIVCQPTFYHPVGQTVEHSVEDPSHFSPREGWND